MRREGPGRHGHGHCDKGGAKTFRRKRAVMFLEHLETKEKVLKKQLETKELQAANPVIAGELKATQEIIADFVQMFELYEFEKYQDLLTRQDQKNGNEKPDDGETENAEQPES
ncbi:hypothetical protein [Ureibacillus terrenus]|uniref:Uncharacterized protein n=2 Tax=Caryophanaceae TaxID=186818 RepID=A0A540V2X1_9BACL|nr:hypothetical protein [Ureibacillus terrenus]MED3763611.1 hypothetical protein [Ureibacillus terrenus]TQE91094.1 hypothetical protein FKZ59_07210 [Ureibacillus terrenus]